MTPDNTEGELTELDAKIISTIKSEFKRPEEIAALEEEGVIDRELS